MDDKNLFSILKLITERINQEFMWRLEGSANLRIQGMNVNVKDLDITTDDNGINFFRSILKEFIVKDCYSEKIKGNTIICSINGYGVEINSYGDRKYGMFDKAKDFLWQGLKFKILPLKYAIEFYKLIKRDEKVRLIENYLKNTLS